MQNSQGSNSSIYTIAEKVRQVISDKISKFSGETLGWVAILFLHGATIPSLLALMTGLTGTPPPIDVVLMIWAGLLLLFAKAAVQRDMLNIITIGLGFMAQAIMMMLIFFK
jgi:hypothetical protein